MAGFPERFIEELKYKCDIVSVISQYVPLVKKGGKYFCCCPFHNEKTASMCVNTDGQYYHCFGCGVSGDVITFIMEMESVGYVDAVKILADKAGLALPEYKGDADYKKKKDKQQVLKELMRDAAKYYYANLRRDEGREAREYLASRGISEEVCNKFGIGLSLDYDRMPAYMRRKNYSVENLRECGLVVGERVSDAFGGRIIVPIMNGMGDVIAFGGRIYHGEKDVAKYKNSTNTLLFDKSRCVYGVNFVKKEKRQNNTGFRNLILVEGYMDVISLAAAGINNAVAGMGTALTPYQAREIRRLVDTVYVCYDGDAAGRKAAIRNVEPLIAEGLEVRVVSLADGLDPDDTVRKEGAEGFLARVNAALPVIEYKLKLCEEAYDLATANGRAKYVTAALKVLSGVQSAAEREVYLGIVSSKSGVSVGSLNSTLGDAKVQPAVRAERAVPADKDAKSLRAARLVLNALCSNCDYASASDVKTEWFSLPAHRRIAEFVKSQPEGKVVAGKLFDLMPDEKEELNRVFGAEVNFDDRAKEKTYYTDCVLVIADEYISARIDELTARYKEVADAAERHAILVEIRGLQTKLKSKNISDKL